MYKEREITWRAREKEREHIKKERKNVLRARGRENENDVVREIMCEE